MSTISPILATVLALCEPFYDSDLDLYGYLDCQGEIGVPAEYIVAQKFTDGGIAAVLDSDGWYYISRTGDFVIRPKLYDNGPDYFSDGLSRFVENHKYGFFDTTGRIVIDAKYEFASPFDNGKAKVGSDCEFVKHGEHTMVECSEWSFIALPGKTIGGAEVSQ